MITPPTDVDKRNRQNTVSNTLVGRYFLDGVYYYPITNPGCLLLAMGPSSRATHTTTTRHRGPTVSYDSVTLDATATAAVSVLVTDPIVTLPNCEDITTQYVLAQNYTPSHARPVILVAATTASSRADHVTTASLVVGIVAVFMHWLVAFVQKRDLGMK